MNYTSHLAEAGIESTVRHESAVVAGVWFRVKRMTLRQRIKLLEEIYPLYNDAEFLKAGETAIERLAAQVKTLKLQEILLRWGIESIGGLVVDGREVAAHEVSEEAPAELAAEILQRVQEAAGLTKEQEKN